QFVEFNWTTGVVENRSHSIGQLLWFAALEGADVIRQTFNIRQMPSRFCRFILFLPNLKACDGLSILILPKRKPALARDQIMKTILERMSFWKLAPHPARTRTMRDNRRHPAHV